VTAAANLSIIIDSGATDHMIPIHCALCEFKADRGEVRLGDNNVRLQILGKGNTPILDKVLLVDGLSFGLISIGRLDKDKCISIFEGGRVYVYDYQGEELLTGTLIDNLYHLDSHYRDILLSNCIPGHPNLTTTVPTYTNTTIHNAHIYMDHRTDEFAFNNSRRRSSNKSVPLSHTHRPIAALDGYIKLELDSMKEIGAIRTAREQYGRGMKMKMLLKPKYDNDFNIV
jgi:hypothetical protein